MLVVKCENCNKDFPDTYPMSEVKVHNGGSKHVCQKCLIKIMNEHTDDANLLLG